MAQNLFSYGVVTIIENMDEMILSLTHNKFKLNKSIINVLMQLTC